MSSEVNAAGYWLMKTEPDEFSIDDLKKRKRHHWDGVRNFEARNFMQNKMNTGDLVIVYHSNGKPSGPAGVARIACGAYPDFTQWNKKSRYFDPRSSRSKPIWYMVDVTFVKSFKRVLPRGILREVPSLREMILWKRPRLSITSLTRREFETIVNLGMKEE